MIPDEEESPDPLDFAWIRFIGRTKLRLTDRQTGRLTMKAFDRLYRIYRDNFDLETMLRHTGTTYAQSLQQARGQEEWF